MLIGILLMIGAAGLVAAPAGLSLIPPSPGAATSSSSADLLQSARATAAPGVGPWGPVAAAPASGPAAPGPNLTFGVLMTYDAADGYVLAVSLNASAGPFNNTYGPSDLTWKFAGGNWSLVPTVGQVPATLSPGLVYDAHDQYVLLYGGRLMGTSAPAAPVTNQTWSYRAGVWTNLSATSTPAPFAIDYPNLVYDAADEYVLLYNELGVTPTNPNGYLNTTWTYASGVWNNLTATAGTPPEWFGAMAYDAIDQYVLYFGGTTWSDQLMNSTWTFHGGVWADISASVTGAPSPRINFGIAYDSLHGYVILYGGLAQLFVYGSSAFSYETWAYAGGAWTRLSSNGTIWSIQTMVYDAADNETVLLGANSSLLVPPNVVTWTFSGGTWVVAAPLFLRGQWATDLGQSITLVVTQSPNAGGLSYQYAGLPPGCAGVNAPTLTCTPTSVGTYTTEVTVTGSAGFLAKSQTTILVNPAPTVLAFSSSGPLGEVGIPTVFQVTAGLGTGGFSYSYVGLPPGCASANSSALRCVPSSAGTFDVTAQIADAVGATASALASIQVVPALAVATFTTDRPVLDVGQSISVVGTVSGGDGPFGYTYSGLPVGCGSIDAARLSCRPNATGLYSVRLIASDALGAIAQAGSSFTVNALPSVVSVVPSNATIEVGGSLSVTTTVSGGTAPFQYSYAGLPNGCTASDSVVTCPSVPTGNYSVAVTVIDATGATAAGTTMFVVLAAPTKIVPPIERAPVEPGFWWGFGIAAVAIAAAALVGGYRLHMARQGQAIVRGLRAPGAGPLDTSEPGRNSPEEANETDR